MGIITVEPPQYDILFRYQPQDFLGPLPTPNDVESGEPLPNHNGSADLVRVREKFVMKYGSEVRPIEAHNMLYVAKHTSVVLPKVYSIYQQREEHNVITFILMQYIQGKTLKELWAELDKTRKTSIAKTLRTSFDQLRQLEHPGYFGNINGGPPLDDVFTGTQGGLDNITSPVATEEELINSVIHIYALETGDRTAHKVRYYHHVLPTVLCSNKAPVFTHNDLQRKNVIVQDDGTVVIIDWEYSSWYPNYWEYASAMFANGGWTDDWDEYLSIILDEYPNEALWVSTMKTEMWS
ncbi:hypothetical protein FPOA_05043 [Fusarium poae]|uniref:Aminoglycoside phosphotransferase domain-containing protein n=1 Tax=Fusarium poae TaxID=36050 RepID=A0A1B8AVF7_FUSPO|nr:hypothetical protein FPOA_05043 [Fusarium poae]